MTGRLAAYAAGLVCGMAAAWLGLVVVETAAAARTCCPHEAG